MLLSYYYVLFMYVVVVFVCHLTVVHKVLFTATESDQHTALGGGNISHAPAHHQLAELAGFRPIDRPTDRPMDRPTDQGVTRQRTGSSCSSNNPLSGDEYY